MDNKENIHDQVATVIEIDEKPPTLELHFQ